MQENLWIPLMWISRAKTTLRTAMLIVTFGAVTASCARGPSPDDKKAFDAFKHNGQVIAAKELTCVVKGGDECMAYVHDALNDLNDLQSTVNSNSVSNGLRTEILAYITEVRAVVNSSDHTGSKGADVYLKYEDKVTKAYGL